MRGHSLIRMEAEKAEHYYAGDRSQKLGAFQDSAGL
jgi:hypothetical protein